MEIPVVFMAHRPRASLDTRAHRCSWEVQTRDSGGKALGAMLSDTSTSTLANLQKSSIGVTSLEFFTCLSLGIQSIPQPDSTDGPPSYFPPRSKSKISLLLSFLTQERLVFSEPTKNLNSYPLSASQSHISPSFWARVQSWVFLFCVKRIIHMHVCSYLNNQK